MAVLHPAEQKLQEIRACASVERPSGGTARWMMLVCGAASLVHDGHCLTPLTAHITRSWASVFAINALFVRFKRISPLGKPADATSAPI